MQAHQSPLENHMLLHGAAHCPSAFDLLLPSQWCGHPAISILLFCSDLEPSPDPMPVLSSLHTSISQHLVMFRAEPIFLTPKPAPLSGWVNGLNFPLITWVKKPGSNSHLLCQICLATAPVWIWPLLCSSSGVLTEATTISDMHRSQTKGQRQCWWKSSCCLNPYSPREWPV